MNELHSNQLCDTQPKEKKIYSVKSATRFSQFVFVKAYSCEQAKLIANKVLFRQYWIQAKEEQEIPSYAFYVDEKGILRQNIESHP